MVDHLNYVFLQNTANSSLYQLRYSNPGFGLRDGSPPTHSGRTSSEKLALHVLFTFTSERETSVRIYLRFSHYGYF